MKIGTAVFHGSADRWTAKRGKKEKKIKETFEISQNLLTSVEKQSSFMSVCNSTNIHIFSLKIQEKINKKIYSPQGHTEQQLQDESIQPLWFKTSHVTCEHLNRFYKGTRWTTWENNITHSLRGSTTAIHCTDKRHGNHHLHLIVQRLLKEWKEHQVVDSWHTRKECLIEYWPRLGRKMAFRHDGK